MCHISINHTFYENSKRTKTANQIVAKVLFLFLFLNSTNEQNITEKKELQSPRNNWYIQCFCFFSLNILAFRLCFVFIELIVVWLNKHGNRPTDRPKKEKKWKIHANDKNGTWEYIQWIAKHFDLMNWNTPFTGVFCAMYTKPRMDVHFVESMDGRHGKIIRSCIVAVMNVINRINYYFTSATSTRHSFFSFFCFLELLG